MIHKFQKLVHGSSDNIKFSKPKLSKIIQSGGFPTDKCGSTSNIVFALDNFVNFPFKVMNSHQMK